MENIRYDTIKLIGGIHRTSRIETDPFIADDVWVNIFGRTKGLIMDHITDQIYIKCKYPQYRKPRIWK